MTRSVILLAAAALALGACDSTGPRVPTALRLDVQAVEVEVNDSTQVEVIVVDASGRDFQPAPSNVSVQWSVADPSIARVTNGYVVGLRAGSTTAVASAAGLQSAQLAIEVVPSQLEGQLSFQYAGHATGSFSVSSGFSVHPETGPTTGDWVVTFHDAEYGSQDVIAQRTRTDGRVDLAWFLVAGQVTQPGTRPATEGVLVLGYSPATQTAQGTYLLTGGTVNFTAASTTRLGGTFTLTFENNGGGVVEVTDGQFDAPIVPVEHILGSPAGDAVSGNTVASGSALRATVMPHRTGGQ